MRVNDQIINRSDLERAQQQMAAEMSVPETDLALVRPGKDVALKLNAFPTTTFLGAVDRIGAQTSTDAGEQYFLVRALFSNSTGRARDGMVGRGRPACDQARRCVYWLRRAR